MSRNSRGRPLGISANLNAPRRAAETTRRNLPQRIVPRSVMTEIHNSKKLSAFRLGVLQTRRAHMRREASSRA